MHKNSGTYILSSHQLLNALRAQGFRNQLDFCSKIGIHRNTLQYYLSGKAVLPGALTRMAKALGMDVLDLLETNDPHLPNVAEVEPIIGALISDKEIAVVLLGSRAKGSATTYADWDLGITRPNQTLSGREFLRLRRIVEDLSEHAPRKVDLINLDAAPAWFLKDIDYEPLMLGGSASSFAHFKGVIDGIRRGQASPGH